MRFFLILFLCLISVTTFATEYSKPNDTILKQRLSPMEYSVTQHQATEPAFHNAYWHNEEPGIYVDIVTGEPLFSSNDKYDSHTGWPSFTKPLVADNVMTKSDSSLLMERIEVVSKSGQTHLGHVFDDGPAPTYKRYCINSAALRFIPVKDLKKRGYQAYLKLFEKQ